MQNGFGQIKQSETFWHGPMSYGQMSYGHFGQGQMPANQLKQLE